MAEFWRAGVNMTISSDDPPFFATTMTDELLGEIDAWRRAGDPSGARVENNGRMPPIVALGGFLILSLFAVAVTLRSGPAAHRAGSSRSGVRRRGSSPP